MVFSYESQNIYYCFTLKYLIITYLSNFGAVEDVDVTYYRGSRRNRGFGFVVFESPKSVTEIMNQSYHIIDNKRVEIKIAIPIIIMHSHSKNAENTTTDNRLAEYPNIKVYESSYYVPQYTLSSEMQYRIL